MPLILSFLFSVTAIILAPGVPAHAETSITVGFRGGLDILRSNAVCLPDEIPNGDYPPVEGRVNHVNFGSTAPRSHLVDLDRLYSKRFGGDFLEKKCASKAGRSIVSDAKKIEMDLLDGLFRCLGSNKTLAPSGSTSRTLECKGKNAENLLNRMFDAHELQKYTGLGATFHDSERSEIGENITTSMSIDFNTLTLGLSKANCSIKGGFMRSVNCKIEHTPSFVKWDMPAETAKTLSPAKGGAEPGVSSESGQKSGESDKGASAETGKRSPVSRTAR